MNKRDWGTLAFGVLIGTMLTILAVMVKDTIRFHAQCDGVVASKEFSTDRYCIDPAVLEGK
jgi:hypothetical protein